MFRYVGFPCESDGTVSRTLSSFPPMIPFVEASSIDDAARILSGEAGIAATRKVAHGLHMVLDSGLSIYVVEIVNVSKR